MDDYVETCTCYPQALFHKYVEDIDFVRSRIAEDEAIREFNRQRDHLEKQVAALKQQLAKSLGGSKSDIGKIMDVSRDNKFITDCQKLYLCDSRTQLYVGNVFF